MLMIMYVINMVVECLHVMRLTIMKMIHLGQRDHLMNMMKIMKKKQLTAFMISNHGSRELAILASKEFLHSSGPREIRISMEDGPDVTVHGNVSQQIGENMMKPKEQS